MKNSKTKKVMAGILAAALITGTAGILINKSDASFKFVVKTEDKVSTADINVEIYELGNFQNKIILNKNTIGNPVKIPVNLTSDKLLPNAWIGKGVNIKNNSSVPIRVKVIKEDVTDKTVSENVALASRLEYNDKNNGSEGVKIEPNANSNVSFNFKFKNTNEKENEQGADNAAIGGEAKFVFKLVIEVE